MGSPTDVHFEAVKRILRYLKGTLGSGLPIHHSPVPSLLVAYSDADWAGCPDTRRSTTGYCVFLGKTLISWSAKKQRTVSRSSAEAEYRALAHACADTIWIRVFFMNFTSLFLNQFFFIVTIYLQPTWLPILSSIPALNMLLLIIILSVNVLLLEVIKCG